QAGDVGIPRPLDGGPVERWLIDAESVAGRIVEDLRNARGGPHDLLRHAADIDAGAADGTGFHQCNPRTVLRRPSGGGDTATAAADHDQVMGVVHGRQAYGAPGPSTRLCSRRR